MKTTKKVLAILLCAVMLFAVAPISSFAGDKTEITAVTIDIRADIAGMKVTDYRDILTIKSDGIVYDNFVGEDEVIYAYRIIDEKVSESVDTDERFVGGETYELWAYFAADSAYCFPEDVNDVDLNVTVDGKSVTCYNIDSDWYTYGDNQGVNYYLFACKVTVNDSNLGFFDKISIALSDFFARIVEFFRSLVVSKK